MIRADIQVCIDILSDTSPSLKNIQNIIVDSNLYLKEIQADLNSANNKDSLQRRIALLSIKVNKQKIRSKIFSFYEMLEHALKNAVITHNSFKTALSLLQAYQNEIQDTVEHHKLEQIIAINLLKLQNMEQQIEFAKQHLELLKDVRNFKSFHINNAVTSFEAIEDYSLQPKELFAEILQRVRQLNRNLELLHSLSKISCYVVLVLVAFSLINMELSISAESWLGSIIRSNLFYNFFNGYYIEIMCMPVVFILFKKYGIPYIEKIKNGGKIGFKQSLLIGFWMLAINAVIGLLIKYKTSMVALHEVFISHPATLQKYTDAAVIINTQSINNLAIGISILFSIAATLIYFIVSRKLKPLTSAMHQVEALAEEEINQKIGSMP
ncbi:hypothetical protein [Pedobacter sp.]|uniref:hypothetical protein n=1 Tax=Pedobacter sp. TaxID=1411316 RepID=UPI003D7F32C0